MKDRLSNLELLYFVFKQKEKNENYVPYHPIFLVGYRTHRS